MFILNYRNYGITYVEKLLPIHLEALDYKIIQSIINTKTMTQLDFSHHDWEPIPKDVDQFEALPTDPNIFYD